MQKSRDLSGYYGFGILPTPKMTPAYATKEFLDRYEEAVNKAAALGMKMCLYDEFWFPSGSAGGLLAAKYPEATAKRLDLVEENVTGPAEYKRAVPAGTLMGVVAMNAATKERIKTINDWCRAHKIQLTGHVDQEEIVNPTGQCGDLMNAFEHQDIPGIDQIFQYGRASKAYKIVSSAANNYDRPLVMTETYGAMQKLDAKGLYREAMDQYAKGINLMVPHAVWYDPAQIATTRLASKSAEFGGDEKVLPRRNSAESSLWKHGTPTPERSPRPMCPTRPNRVGMLLGFDSRCPPCALCFSWKSDCFAEW